MVVGRLMREKSVRQDILPSIGAKIHYRNRIGIINQLRDIHSGWEALVTFAGGEKSWLPIKELTPAYEIGSQVQHKPIRGGLSLGAGRVLAVRRLAGFDQVLVQFFESGEVRWLDWRLLANATPVEMRIAKRIVGPHENHAERFRLRVLSKALQIWNANTGAFGRLDIDPLPHQLDVARKVVTSPQARWLIADDVGLGKTIEVGLILHALTQRNRCRRVLIVCPASLTKQWKDEMRSKFGRAFEIYGRDFMPEYADEMRLRDNVIISLDLGKRDEHLARLVEAGHWDVIVFDEAHRLGRSETGEQTERYLLARRLRDRTHSLLLLTATPHQGKSRRFAALLELVRPDLTPQIQTLEMNPELVGEIIIRNKKSRVTDAEGKLIFRGHDTIRHKVVPSEAMKAADRALRDYLNAGYRASFDARDRALGRAIGFVMTTYRKLASSSLAAIERALERRLERLANYGGSHALSLPSEEDIEGNDLLTETTPISQMTAFFEDEASEVRYVLERIRIAKKDDAKLSTFLKVVLEPLLAGGHSLLVFTEYRATQDYLVDAIQSVFRDIGVATINGSMSLEQKIENVNRFNRREARVMISTEAGGEGINLHQTCHVMVNYDLPWNPARLVQRIGRLYRYGQQKRVQVINLQADDGFDNSAISLMLDRVITIANDMAAVSGDDSQALASEILGDLMANIDMESILDRATTMKMEQTEEEIAEAIRLAQDARAAEDDILQYALAQQTRVAGGFDWRHMVSFVKGMLDLEGIEVRNILHDGRTIEIVLPDEAIGQWPEFGRRSVVRLTADHARALEDPTLVPVDFEGSFVRYLAKRAGDRLYFDGLYGEAISQDDSQTIAVQQVRWQGLSGELLEEELVALTYKSNGWQELAHDDFANFLLSPLDSREPSSATETSLLAARSLDATVDGVLTRKSFAGRMPTSVFVTAALGLVRS